MQQQKKLKSKKNICKTWKKKNTYLDQISSFLLLPFVLHDVLE